MAGAEYWIWLQKALGPASSVACKLVAHFGNPENLYYAGREKWLASGIVNKTQCDKLCQFSPSQSFDVMMLCLKYELEAVTPDSPYYPKQLLRIRDYPMVLYVKGKESARVLTTGLVLTCLVVLAFVCKMWMENAWCDLYTSTFDITYLSLGLPFYALHIAARRFEKL